MLRSYTVGKDTSVHYEVSPRTLLTILFVKTENMSVGRYGGTENKLLWH